MPSSIVAHVTLESFSPYHQSKNYEVPRLDGESHNDYDRRCWRHHQHVRNGMVYIPARAIHMALGSGAAYDGTKIQGKGNKTWTQKFYAGIALFKDVDLGVDAETTDYIDIFAHADGKRTSGSRVPKRFPVIYEWQAEFDVHILDPIITRAIFHETMETAGMFVGIGQYRPEKGGTAGRFRVVSIDWKEELKPIQRHTELRQTSPLAAK